MIDLNADILSFQAAANIFIQDNILDYIDEMYAYFHVTENEYIHFNEKSYGYILDDGSISVFTDADGVIKSVICHKGYEGRYNNTIYVGITMEELKQMTQKQRILNGALIINDDFGLSLSLPAPYDEIADTLKDIPINLPFNEIVVANHLFWK